MALAVVRDELPPAELLAQLRAGDQRPLNALYERHRRGFLKWAAHRYPNLREADLIDAYQDAIVTFYENVMSGRLTELTATPQTYLFRLGERRCQLFSKNSAKIVKVLPTSAIKGMENLSFDTLLTLNSGHEPLDDDPFGLFAAEETAELRHATVAHGLQQLPRDCHRLLTAVYYENQPTAALVEAFDYRDASVLYTRKSHCLARLRVLCGLTTS